MTTPLSSSHDTLSGRVSLRVDVKDTAQPLDVTEIEGLIQAATQDVTRQLSRLKFARDIRLLRAALYALGSNLTITEATTDIEDDAHAEHQGNELLHGYLAAQAWRPYEPVDGRFTILEDEPSMFGNTFPKKLGQKYGGDVIVSLWDGRTLKADAKDAHTFEWIDVTTREVYVPRPDDRWWFVRNYKNPKDIGHDPYGEKQRASFRAVTVPEVPADLTALLARIPEEN